jgi:hypothetical protein
MRWSFHPACIRDIIPAQSGPSYSIRQIRFLPARSEQSEAGWKNIADDPPRELQPDYCDTEAAPATLT